MCVFMVDGVSALVDVMLSLMSVMSPANALCKLSVRMVVKLCTLGVFVLGVSMCVGNKQFGLLGLFLIPFMLTCSMMRFLSFLLLVICVCMVPGVVWSSLVCL